MTGSVVLTPDTPVNVDDVHHAVFIGEWGGHVRISGDPDDLVRLASALILVATDAREAALVDALGTAGQPQTAGAA